MTELTNPSATSLYINNSPIICQDKGVWHCGYCTMHYKHVCHLSETKYSFKKLTITVHAQNIFLLLFKNYEYLEKTVWHEFDLTDLKKI